MRTTAWKENQKVTMDDMLGLEPLVAVLKDRLSPIYSLVLDLLKQHQIDCTVCSEKFKCDIVKRAESLGLL